MDSSGVRDELNLINKKQKALRDQLVLNNHLTNDDTPRVITHHEPTEGNPKDYYITRVADGKKIKTNTLDALMDRLYLYYADGLLDFSVGSVFRLPWQKRLQQKTPSLEPLKRTEGILRDSSQLTLLQRT